MKNNEKLVFVVRGETNEKTERGMDSLQKESLALMTKYIELDNKTNSMTNSVVIHLTALHEMIDESLEKTKKR